VRPSELPRIALRSRNACSASFLDRVREQPGMTNEERAEVLRSVQERFGHLLDAWVRVVDGYQSNGVATKYQQYEDSPAKPLLREMLDTEFDSLDHKLFRVNRSMREVEPSVNVFVRTLTEMNQREERMSFLQDGQIRRSQVITTYGPGALIDLPDEAAIMGGLNTWPRNLERILEPRLERKLELWTGVPSPELYLPPPDTNDYAGGDRGVTAWSFPEWFVIQEQSPEAIKNRTRRFVHRRGLDGKRKFDGCGVVPTRFVRACPRGHVDDIDWMYFVHQTRDRCMKSRLWLDESGTSGDLAELKIRCECGKFRDLQEAAVLDTNPARHVQRSAPVARRDAQRVLQLNRAVC
jgi:hypothetical protein